MKLLLIWQCALAASITPTDMMNVIEQETHSIGALVGVDSSSPINLGVPPTSIFKKFKNFLLNKESRWISLPEKRKSQSIASMTWPDLKDYQRFWYMKIKLGIDAGWSRDRLNEEIRTNLPNLRKIIKVKPYTWAFSKDGMMYSGEREELEWIGLLPANKRTIDETKMFSFFTRNSLVSKFMPFDSFNEAAQADIIKAILIQHVHQPTDEILTRRIMDITKWSQLPADLQFISFKDMFPLPMADLSLQEFQTMIKDDLPTLRGFIQPTLDLLTEQGAVYPEQLFWIEQLAPSERTPSEQLFYGGYGHGFFDHYKSLQKRLFVQLSEHDKIQSFEVRSILPLSKDEIAWIHKRPAEQVSGSLRLRILLCMPWTELPNEIKFLSFKGVFGLPNDFTSKEFEAGLKKDFLSMQAFVQPTLKNRYANPQELYWLERVPVNKLTKVERGMLNAYGFGYFDRETVLPGLKFAPRQWEELSLANQAFRIYQNIDKDPAHLEAFKKVISDGLGKEQVSAAVAAIEDIQGWIITFVNRSLVQLSAKQKSWALAYFSTLKNPQGIQAFEDLTIRIALDSGNK